MLSRIPRQCRLYDSLHQTELIFAISYLRGVNNVFESFFLVDYNEELSSLVKLWKLPIKLLHSIT